MTYPEFEKKYLNTPNKENFEKENDGMDWRFYYESYKLTGVDSRSNFIRVAKNLKND